MNDEEYRRRLERRIYRLSECDRLLVYFDDTWYVIEAIAEKIGKTPQAVLQMAASLYPADVFERHGREAPQEMKNRIIQWGEGLMGEPVNVIPDPMLAPQP